MHSLSEVPVSEMHEVGHRCASTRQHVAQLDLLHKLNEGQFTLSDVHYRLLAILHEGDFGKFRPNWAIVFCDLDRVTWFCID